MKKNYILLWVDEPAFDALDKQRDWGKLVKILETQAKLNKEIQTLAQNVWLLPRDAGLPFAAECIGRASNCQLTHHALFLDSAA